MKKFVFIIAVFVFSINGFSQSFNLVDHEKNYTGQYFNMNNNKNGSIGMGISLFRIPKHNVTYTETINNASNIVMYNVTASFYGVYLNISASSNISTGARHSMDITEHMNDGRASIFHIGYKSPITKNLYIYPIVGYAELTTGYCNGSDYYFSSDGDVINRYTPVDTFYKGFDFGAGIDIKLFNLSNLNNLAVFASISCTKCTKINVSLSLGYFFN